ncbi:hypothetical protein F5Y15DRAFT_277862 [Xylariaceae sp. FL0016]|nr:hypothetical protein F5Y15DRAFT_277862 [Xylariaceae sp. FL0016]
MSTENASPVCVTVSALDAGHLTLPERLFVTDADPEKRSTVPSLSFLIRHPSTSPSSPERDTTNLIFDLGIKRDPGGYTPAQQDHVAQRQPVITDPDCAASLRKGAGVDPSRDVDLIILSHVHWDHVGTPGDFPGATFAVGSGTLDLLKNGAGPLYPAALFNDDEVPADRTVEFPPVPRDADGDSVGEYETGPYVPKHTPTPEDSRVKLPAASSAWSWKPHGGFAHALDLFGDGSVYVIDSPGHLYGHVNLLVRVAPRKHLYLGGDCCHDPRILSGEKGFALYDDGRGGLRSVHVHTGTAQRTLDKIMAFMREEGKGELGTAQVEVVVAHDAEWRETNKERFWPGTL